MRQLLFFLLRLSCRVARNAKFISLGKQWGNKCLIVVTGIHLRRGCLQLSAFSCETQTHLTLNSEGQKKGRKLWKMQQSSAANSYIRPSCFLMRLLLPALRTSVIDFAETLSSRKLHMFRYCSVKGF